MGQQPELQASDHERKEVKTDAGVSAVTAPTQQKTGSARGGKKQRRRKPRMAPHEVRAFRQDFSGALLNTALHLQLGKSRREALITRMAASIRDSRLVRHPEHVSEEDIETVKATFDLHHFLQHYYRQGRQYWALLEEGGERVPVTCLEVRPGDRCMVVLDRENQEHEIFFRNREEVEHRVEDAERRELRQLRKNLAHQKRRESVLEKHLDSLQKQLRNIQEQIGREQSERAQTVKRLSQLEKAYDERRHKVSRIVGSVTRKELFR